MLLLHGYLWFRLVRSTPRPGRLRRRLTLLTLLLALLPALAVSLRRTLPHEVATPLDWVAYSWLGIAFYAFLALLVLEPVRLTGRAWLDRANREVVASGARRAPRSDDAAAHPDRVREDGDVRSGDGAALPRRLFLARGLAVTAGAVAVGTAGTGAYFA